MLGSRDPIELHRSCVSSIGFVIRLTVFYPCDEPRQSFCTHVCIVERVPYYVPF